MGLWIFLIILFFDWELYTMYFDQIYPSNNFSQIYAFLPTHPTSCFSHLFLYLSYLKKLIKTSFFWPTTLGCPTLECDQYTRWYTIKEDWLFLSSRSHQVAIAPQLWVGLYAYFPFSMLGFFGLSLCRSCACCHNCCDFIFASALVCTENTVFFKKSATSASYNLTGIPFY